MRRRRRKSSDCTKTKHPREIQTHVETKLR